MDDNVLVQAIAKGDKKALHILYERHHKFILHLAFRYLANEEDARDIVQDVFIELFRFARHYEEKGQLSTWLYRVTVNRCINHKKSAYYRLREHDIKDAIFENLATKDEELAEQKMMTIERQKLLLEALHKLPKQQRMAMILSRFNELSYREIAQSMNISESSVTSLLFRARKNLKKIILSLS